MHGYDFLGVYGDRFYFNNTVDFSTLPFSVVSIAATVTLVTGGGALGELETCCDSDSGAFPSDPGFFSMWASIGAGF